MSGNNETINGTKITMNDIYDFYYTFSNINYNAFYQRYRFYKEDGRYMFLHDTREVKNDYGPAEEKDRIAFGTFELTESEWAEFFNLIKDGTVKKRSEHTESGDSGPWLYIYTDKGSKDGEEYYFADYGAQQTFVEYCEKLAER